jgi:hypothetical protein
MQDEESKVEARPQGAKPEVKAKIGRLDSEESVSLAAPSPIKKGTKAVPRAAVGLRAAVPSSEVSPKGVEARNQTRQRVREDRDKHRQKVWDKLDEARRKAEEKRPRLDRFKPLRPGEEPPEPESGPTR